MSKKIDHYLGNPNLKAKGVNVEFTKEQVGEYLKCQQDPIHFIKKYVKIIHLDRGLIDFDLYDFQEHIVDTIHNNRFVICKLPRQSGKSTTTIAYLLHYVLFNSESSVAILANKQATARELLHRLQLAYEHLPKWLQQGVEQWNKGSIELENGSRIIASATSSSAIRGSSFNLIFLDEFAFVPHEVADEFFSSVYPTITSGKTTKVLMVSTPHGMNLFYKFWTDAENGRSSYVPIEVHWSQVPGRDEKWKRETIANTSETQFRTEFECDFVGSVNTLIEAKKLKELTYNDPTFSNDEGFDVLKEPEEDHTYVMCVDVSRGQGLDYHAFTIIDITEMPYRVVAKFRNNQMSPLVYPNAIYAAAMQYNKAHILVELNDIGGQVADVLHHDMEYDHLLVTTVRGRKGQTLDGGFGSGQSQYGIRTTEAVKRIGCSLLKSMVEENKLIVEDFDIIKEFVSFISKKKSYQAETGHHDDLVMTLVLFGWLTTQTYFKELTNLDIRRDLYEDKMKQIEDDMTPFGFIEDGINNQQQTYIDQFGDTWTVDERNQQDQNNDWI
tara:strand:+ start:5744 stop:7405 length:1662 start_codon:yes stop_codon:yes gene_type:complete